MTIQTFLTSLVILRHWMFHNSLGIHYFIIEVYHIHSQRAFSFKLHELIVNKQKILLPICKSTRSFFSNCIGNKSNFHNHTRVKVFYLQCRMHASFVNDRQKGNSGAAFPHLHKPGTHGALFSDTRVSDTFQQSSVHQRKNSEWKGQDINFVLRLIPGTNTSPSSGLLLPLQGWIKARSEVRR